MNVILSKIRNARKLRELVSKTVHTLTTTTQYAISEQENAKNALLIQLNQVAFQIKPAMHLASLNHQLNTCMNATGFV